MNTTKSSFHHGRTLAGLLLGGALVLTGCAGTPSHLNGPEQSWRDARVVSDDQRTTVVVYRQKKGDSGEQAPAIWAGERLIGALLPGQYLQAAICPGSQEIRVVPRQAGALTTRNRVNANAGDIQYLRIRPALNGYFIEPVSAGTARQEMADLKHLSHLVNRQAVSCAVAAAEPVVVPPPAEEPVLLRQVELGADALFRFNSASISDILPEGREALDRLARDIRESITVQRISITGHTDWLGSEAYNDRLSEQRAAAVAQYLRDQGIAGRIDIAGRGKRDPVASCPGNLPVPELIACLQPDRRVTIELWGARLEPNTADPS